jgi:hypothetical protein
MWVKSAPPHPKPINGRAAASAVCAGIALIMVPLFAAGLGGAAVLTKLGHQIAFFIGVVMVVYGSAAVSYVRAAREAFRQSGDRDVS